MREVTFNHLTVIPIFEHKRESALSKLKLLLFMNEYILQCVYEVPFPW